MDWTIPFTLQATPDAAPMDAAGRWPQSVEQFEVLVEAVQDELVHFAFCRLRSLEDAEDAVQDVLVRAYLEREKRRAVTGVRPYLFRMVANRCTDVLRQRQRAERRRDPSDPAGLAAGPGPDPEARPKSTTSPYATTILRNDSSWTAATRTGGTDHRRAWSVGMGVPPANLHEKRWGRRFRFRLPTVGPIKGWQAEAPAPPTAPTGRGSGWFFDPVKQLRQECLTDDKRRSSVPLSQRWSAIATAIARGMKPQAIAHPDEDPPRIKKAADPYRRRQLPHHGSTTGIDIGLRGFGYCQENHRESKRESRPRRNILTH
jgi:hypothetical protein